MQTHYVSGFDSIDPEVIASVIKIDDTFLDVTPPEFENWMI